MEKNIAAILLLSLFFYCKTVPYKEIPDDFVYSIKQHGDSIYYSTNSGEIYSFHIENSAELRQVGLKKNHPIRSLLFLDDSTLFASSYRSGFYRVINDTLSTYPGWYHPAWSMKADPYGKIWLAGRYGIYKQCGDTFELFGEMKEAFDIAFYNNELVIGHYNGISFYDMDSRRLIRTLCKDTICWMTTTIDTTLICGGVECCVIISGNNVKTVKLGPENNIPWACAVTSSHSILLATEKGLYQIKEDENEARCIGYYKKCIKSVFFDSKGTLWVGRYF